jgi:AraC-like DNA-binding protein
MPPKARKRRRLSNDAARRLFHRSADLYLHACYGTGTPARCDEYAAWLRMTRPYLSRLAPRVLGTSLHDFLRSKQLAHAQQLLRTTPSSVQTIAIRSGFGTETTFARHFRAAFGITPTEYRQREAAK